MTALQVSKWELEQKHEEQGIELISQHCWFTLDICELDIKKKQEQNTQLMGKVNPLLGELLSKECGNPTITTPCYVV